MEIKRINTEKITIDDVAYDMFNKSFDELFKDLKRIVGDVYLGNITNMIDDGHDSYLVDTPTQDSMFVSKWLFDDDKDLTYEDEDEYCDGDCLNCPHYDGKKAEVDEEDTMCEDDDYDLDKEFKVVVAPVIKWLNENAPSHLAVITANHAVLSEVTNVTAG